VPVRILHEGYEGDLTQKHRRNLRLLRRAVEKEPGNAFLWARLGQTLSALDETEEATDAALRALELAREGRGSAADTGRACQVLVGLMGKAGTDASALVEEGVRAAPENLALQFARARFLIERERYEEALAILGRFAAIDVKRFRPNAVGYDERLLGELAHDLRGVALLRLERFGEAAAAFEDAAEAAPENPSYRVKAAAMRGRAAAAARAVS
jgi:tetratricopeptide (TPR) repeat protein